MKLISTRPLGILDYLSVGALCALPRIVGWDRPVTRLLTGAGVRTLACSLLTRCELGVLQILPMPAHLALDGTSGALLCGAPFLFLDEERPVTMALVGIGLFAIGASLLTQTQPRSSMAPLVRCHPRGSHPALAGAVPALAFQGQVARYTSMGP